MRYLSMKDQQSKKELTLSRQNRIPYKPQNNPNPQAYERYTSPYNSLKEEFLRFSSRNEFDFNRSPTMLKKLANSGISNSHLAIVRLFTTFYDKLNSVEAQKIFTIRLAEQIQNYVPPNEAILIFYTMHTYREEITDLISPFLQMI